MIHSDQNVAYPHSLCEIHHGDNNSCYYCDRGELSVRYTKWKLGVNWWLVWLSTFVPRWCTRPLIWSSLRVRKSGWKEVLAKFMELVSAATSFQTQVCVGEFFSWPMWLLPPDMSVPSQGQQCWKHSDIGVEIYHSVWHEVWWCLLPWWWINLATHLIKTSGWF